MTMDVFKRVNGFSMWPSLLVSWIIIKTSLGNSCKALETVEYFVQLYYKLCLLQTSVISPYQMTPTEAFLYSALIVTLASCLELVAVSFRKAHWGIHNSNNNLSYFLIVRGGLLVGLIIYMSQIN